MKRLTKAACKYAATELAKIAFDKKSAEATEKLKKVGDELILKYIPKSLMDCFNEHRDLFCYYRNCISIGSQGSFRGIIQVSSSIANPIGSTKAFRIPDDEFVRIEGIVDDYKNICRQRNNYQDTVADKLYELRTINRIKEKFPEALKYISIDLENEEKTNNLNELRQMLK